MSTSHVSARKLPVFATVGATYAFVFENLAAVVRLALLPAGLGALTAFAAALTLPSLGDLEQVALEAGALDAGAFNPAAAQAAAVQGMTTFLWAQTASLVVQAGLGLWLAVAWLRHVLSAGPQGRRPEASFGRSLLAYAVASLQALGLAMLALGMIAGLGFVASLLLAGSSGLSLLGGVMLILACVLGFGLVMFVLVRVSPILSARAMGDSRMRFAEVFSATRGNFWRLFLGSLLAALPGAMLVGLLSVIGGQLLPLGTLPWAIGQGLIGGLAVALSVMALTFAALSFRALVERTVEPF